ncbi:transposase [Vibrio coralliirubri]|nr:transposase [Vibrio coralliirubri]
MSTIQTIGVDLAKNVFSIHGVDAYGKCVLCKTVKRNKLLDTCTGLMESDTELRDNICQINEVKYGREKSLQTLPQGI